MTSLMPFFNWRQARFAWFTGSTDIHAVPERLDFYLGWSISPSSNELKKWRNDSENIVNELEKWRKECENIFHRAVTEDAGGLAPVKDDNADLWKIGR